MPLLSQLPPGHTKARAVRTRNRRTPLAPYSLAICRADAFAHDACPVPSSEPFQFLPESLRIFAGERQVCKPITLADVEIYSQ